MRGKGDLHRAEDREQRYLDDLHLLCNALKKVVPIKKTERLGQQALACQRLTAQPTASAQ